MISAENVKPAKWSNIRVLFDNGSYSVITGFYEGEQAMGERWNGEEDKLGFPNQAGNPLWHVIPDFLEIHILHSLIDELYKNPYKKCDKHEAEILKEIKKRNKL